MFLTFTLDIRNKSTKATKKPSLIDLTQQKEPAGGESRYKIIIYIYLHAFQL